MYNKNYKYNEYKNMPKNDESTIEEEFEVVEEQMIEEETTKKEKIGVVSGCSRLNVREKPNKDSEVVCVIDESTEVIIDESISTDDFYKIYTESSAEGFCMKQFITIK